MSRDEAAHPEPPPARRRDLRFRRPLTAAELRSVEAAAAAASPGGAVEAVFRALWDGLLNAAEGVSFAEAAERGLRFHPDDYAIPASQAEHLLGVLNRASEAFGSGERSVSMSWLALGPATYDDELDERR
jgi:hypothetical protein